MKNIRGLSGVITTLIIILLVIVAVGIVWAVVGNMLSEGAEQISLGKFTINLEIEKVTVNEGTVNVKVKRNPGKGEISGMNFVISDGVNSEVIEKPTTIQELGKKTFTLDYSGLVKEISIVPIFKTESGKEQTGNEADKFEFSNKEIIKNLGAVSWWRFNGNTDDEIGENHGEKFGGVDCNVEGKFGKACSFDGSSGYVNVPAHSVLENPTEHTIVFWINPRISSCGIGQHGTSLSNYDWYLRITEGLLEHHFVDTQGTVNSFPDPSLNVNIDEWNFVVLVRENTKATLYLNDQSQSHIFSYPPKDSSGAIEIGQRTGGHSYSSVWFNGIIDEPMIFNKALTEEQVKALYELKLN